MATAILNPVFVSISGRIGGFVFYRRKKTQCIRTYFMPRNPDTLSQRNVRNSFANAVKSWQALTAEERFKYLRKARGRNLSGYNLFISEYMKETVTAGPKPGVIPFIQGLVIQHALYNRIHSVSASIINQSLTFPPEKELLHNREPT